MRLDKAIFERKLTPSRSRAEQLIALENVTVNGKIVTKPSFEVTDEDVIAVEDSIGYVGRGGLKLEKALTAFGIDVTGKTVLDIGASTGGFTECLLRFGAKRVIAVDVGHGQMAEHLACDPRVTLFENTNARFLTQEQIGTEADAAVMDVSFISQKAIYPALFSCVSPSGVIVTLVKPQFEVGSAFLNKKGIVKDKRKYWDVLLDLDRAAREIGRGISGLCLSPIKGGDGNTEFLIAITASAKFYDLKKEYDSLARGMKG